MRRLALVLALFAVAGVSCVGGGRIGGGSIGTGGGGNGGGESNPAVAPGAQAMPALPAAHGGSTIPEAWIFGKDTYQRSAGAVEQDTALRLEPTGPAGYEWAMYRINLAHTMGSLRVRLAAPEGGAYVGLSNYARGGWEFNGPYSGDAVILPYDGKCYEATTGQVYCLVVAAGKTVTVKQVVAKTVFGEPVVVSGKYDEQFGATALAVVSGFPAICYDVREPWPALEYVRALDPAGLTWAEPVEVYHWPGSGGVYPGASLLTLAEVDGKPAIGADVDLDYLEYFRALDSLGSTWDEPTVIDTASQGLYFPSTALADDRPAFSYVVCLPSPSIDLELRFVVALDANGITWDAPVTLEHESYLSIFASLAVVNGRPAVSCSTSLYGWNDSWYDCLVYRQAGDPSGASWFGQYQVPDKSMYGKCSGLVSSLGVISGNPAIAYYGGSDSPGLYYVRSLDSEGSAWGAPVAVDPDPNLGVGISLAMVGGNPAIIYYTSRYVGDQDIVSWRYVRALDATGDTWDTPVAVNGGADGADRALVEVNGKAAVTYVRNKAVYYLRSF